jgi:hypothetical protein
MLPWRSNQGHPATPPARSNPPSWRELKMNDVEEEKSLGKLVTRLPPCCKVRSVGKHACLSPIYNVTFIKHGEHVAVVDSAVEPVPHHPIQCLLHHLLRQHDDRVLEDGNALLTTKAARCAIASLLISTGEIRGFCLGWSDAAESLDGPLAGGVRWCLRNSVTTRLLCNLHGQLKHYFLYSFFFIVLTFCVIFNCSSYLKYLFKYIIL